MSLPFHQKIYTFSFSICSPTGLIVSCIMTTIMGCFFAKKSKQGREKSLNPLNYALGFGIFDTLLGLTLAACVDATSGS